VEDATIATVRAFQAALDAHDLEGVCALLTDDCVFENTSPSPDGERFEGLAAVGDFWRRFLEASPAARFTEEEAITTRDRCVVRWRYDWGDGHVRGVDLFRVRDGKVAEKLSYVKG
jgi:ketosteroid isomerase-like protein